MAYPLQTFLLACLARPRLLVHTLVPMVFSPSYPDPASGHRFHDAE